MIDAVHVLASTLTPPLSEVATQLGFLSVFEADLLVLPALSSRPSKSIYAGLKLPFGPELSDMLSNAFGTVS